MSGIPTVGSGPGFQPAPDAETLDIKVRDRGLAKVLPQLIEDGIVSGDDAKALIASAKDGWGLVTATEKKDLTRVLEQAGGRVEPEARKLLTEFLGLPGTFGAPATGAGAGAAGTGATTGTTPLPSAADLWSSLATPPALSLDDTGTRRPVALGDNYRFTSTPGQDAGTVAEIGSGMFAAASLIDDTLGNLFDSIGLDASGQAAMLGTLKEDLARVSAGGTTPSGMTDVQALQLRSSASTVLLELLTAKGADPAVQAEALTAYRGLIDAETNPLLKDGMVFHLDGLRDAIPTGLHGQIDEVMEVVKPDKPPYEDWFANGNDTVKVEWVNGDSECKEISTHQLKGDGFEVVEDSYAKTVFRKEVEENGVKTVFEVHMRSNRGDMYEEVQDQGDSNMVVYTGHSNWGRNMRTALGNAETGEKGGAGKLVLTDLCVGKGEIQMFRDKFPNADLVTTHNSSYYSVAGLRSEGDATFRSMIKDIAGRRGYEAMAENVREGNPWGWDHRSNGVDNNFIFPSDLKTRRMVLDRDHDGQADVFDRLVSFDTFNTEVDTAREFQPIDNARPADEIEGTKVHFASQTINRLALYSGINRDANSSGNVVPAGYFQGGPDDKQLFKFDEQKLESGETVLALRMNSRFAHMSEEAVRMAACFEYAQHVGADDPRLDDQGAVLSGMLLASHSLDTDAGHRDSAVWGEFLKAYNLPEIPRRTIESAKNADSHEYSGSHDSIEQLERELDPAVLAALTTGNAGRIQ